MTTKRFLLVALIALLLAGVVLQIAPPSNGRYRADSMVVAMPYTNALFTRSFESHVVRTIPGVLRLEVMPSSSWATGSAALPAPNAVAIRIIAVGATAQDAQHAANEAAAQFKCTVLTNYGVKGEVVDGATSARSYSYFHDSFQPAVGRLFKH